MPAAGDLGGDLRPGHADLSRSQGPHGGGTHTGKALYPPHRLRPHTGRSGKCAANGPGVCPRAGHRRVRLRRGPGNGKAPPDGAGGGETCGLRCGHKRQSPHRGPGGHYPGHSAGHGSGDGAVCGGAGPEKSHCSGHGAGPGGRCDPPVRQRTRDLPGDRKRNPPYG